MKIAAVLARHRRLLALCGVSLLLHVLVIQGIASRTNSPPKMPPAAAPRALALRLRAPQESLPQRPPGLPAPAEPAHASNAPPPRAAAAATKSPSEGPVPSLATPAAAADPVPAPDAPGAAATLVQMPGSYRVDMPPAARLTYALSHTLPGGAAAAAGTAQIIWQTDGNRYQLRVDGVVGQLSSEGGSSDTGIAPLAATEQRADGSLATTRFDLEAHRIVFSTSARRAPILTGSQDRASLLMQLAGMGLAEPDQMRGVIEVVVAGAQDVEIQKFQVLGQEDVETSLGTLPSWRLAQVARPGETRLELWLAPQHGWLPVQLRATAPDGTVSTQVVTQIER